MNATTLMDGKVIIALKYDAAGFPELDITVRPEFCKDKRPIAQVKINGVIIHKMSDPNNDPWRPPMEAISLGWYDVIKENGILTAYRNGFPWESKTKELAGDNLALAMFERILLLEKKLQEKD